jgi:hypothetical protein
MKKFFLLSTLLVLTATSLPARQEVVRLTRYEGDRITGVSARGMFQVQLVKSEQTRAVVELSAELEQYLQFGRASDGTVEVSLRIPDGERNRMQRDRDFWNKKTIRLTLFLPEIERIALNDMSHLRTEDAFTGADVTIRVDDMSNLHALTLTADKVDVQCNDMSRVSLNCTVASATASANDMSKIQLEGTAKQAKVTSNDMSHISAAGMTAERGEVHAHDMSSAALHVTRSLLLRSSDMGRASYTGNPPSVDIRTPRRTEYRQAE